MADPSEFTVNNEQALGNNYESLGVHEEYRSHYPFVATQITFGWLRMEDG